MNSEKTVFLCGNSKDLNNKVFNSIASSQKMDYLNNVMIGKLKTNKNITVIKSNKDRISENLLYLNEYDKIMFIADSYYLEKNLNLILRIMEINSNLLLCLKNSFKVKINTNLLSSILKIDVINIENFNLDMLYSLISIENTENYNIEYEEMEDDINKISNLLPDIDNKRYVSMKLLEGDKTIIKIIKDRLDIDILTTEINDSLRDINFENIKDIVYENINRICDFIANEVIEYEEKITINKVLSSRIIGIFLVIVFLMLNIILTFIYYNVFFILSLKVFNYFVYLIPDIDNYIYNFILSGVKFVYLSIFLTFIPAAILAILNQLVEESGILSLIMFHLDKIFNKFGSSGKFYKLYLDKYSLNEFGISDFSDNREKSVFILSSIFYPSIHKFILIVFFASLFFPHATGLKLILILSIVFLVLIIISLIVSKVISIFKYKNESVEFNIELPMLKLPKLNVNTVLKNKLKSIFIRTTVISFALGLILNLISNFEINNIFFISFLNVFEKELGINGIIIISFIFSLFLNESALLIVILLYLNTGTINLELMENILINNDWTIKTVMSACVLFLFNLPNIFIIYRIKKEIDFKYKWLIIIFPFILALFIIVFNN